MRLEHLYYLLTVAKCRSINKASQKLCLKQQNLSKLITAIEQEFGCTIFIRSTKGIIPTKEGQVVLEAASDIIKILENTQNTIAQMQHEREAVLQGTLTLHAAIRIWLSDYEKIIASFSNQYPNISIQLDEQSTEDIVISVVCHQDHIGLISVIKGRDYPAFDVPDGLIFIPMYHRNVSAYAHKDSAYAQKYDTISLKSLQRMPLIAYRQYDIEKCPAYKLLEPYGKPAFKYSVSNIAMLCRFLQKGDCIYLGSLGNMQTLEIEYQLKAIPVRDDVQFEAGILIQQSYAQEPLAKAFIAHYQQLLFE